MYGLNLQQNDFISTVGTKAWTLDETLTELPPIEQKRGFLEESSGVAEYESKIYNQRHQKGLSFCLCFGFNQLFRMASLVPPVSTLLMQLSRKRYWNIKIVFYVERQCGEGSSAHF
ncbi:hypothetical protein T4B_5209 [Trichinella pseudospiralis]|uniref:Uncharacterized protein n=1 Tax=Trichinella pseudospiralis TaxID=6337 RepID=A0A0V1JHV1_TRIPS|nr:hypothetical protein T4B_5209 [Trichinella pseudospiralis]